MVGAALVALFLRQNDATEVVLFLQIPLIGAWETKQMGVAELLLMGTGGGFAVGCLLTAISFFARGGRQSATEADLDDDGLEHHPL